MPTIEQIRAARALLNWSQGDLAMRANLSQTGIARIENGVNTPNTGTMDKIIGAFSQANLEFINGGVRKTTDFVEIFEGQDCYLQLVDHIFRGLIDTGHEFLLWGADERRSTPAVIQKRAAMQRAGIPYRALIEQGNTHILGDLKNYRWMPPQLFADTNVKVLYGDRVAHFISWHEIPKVFIIKEKNIFLENKKIFDYVWDLSTRPTHTTAETSYE